MEDAQKELDETKSKSATTLLATEDEILELKAEWVIQPNIMLHAIYSMESCANARCVWVWGFFQFAICT